VKLVPTDMRALASVKQELEVAADMHGDNQVSRALSSLITSDHPLSTPLLLTAPVPAPY
jgi:hypothetical protein